MKETQTRPVNKLTEKDISDRRQLRNIPKLVPALIFLGILLLIALFAIFMSDDTTNPNSEAEYSDIFEEPKNEITSQLFIKDLLRTDTSKYSIDLEQILSGGPSKDGIPAVNSPQFTAIEDVRGSLGEETLGIYVEVDGVVRFYPYNILVWHEIVNDEVNGLPLSITFCPLCGSAIVYKRTVGDEVLRFGVSGKLYQSNMLMYDTKTESLWSQSIGEAVVGTMLGTKLDLYPMQLVTFAQVKETYPNAEILSEETGFSRNYDFYPYGDYDNNDELYFSINVRNERFELKEIMFVFNYEDISNALVLSELAKQDELSYDVNNKTLLISYDKGAVTVTDEDGNDIPGYFEMWFSWATQHPDSGNVWPTK